LFVLASLSVATFPGEPHVNLFTGRALFSVQCERWLHQAFGRADLRVDRLVLQFVDVVDDEKLKRIQSAIDASGEPDVRGEPTQKFGERDLACGVFSDADLRQVDFSRARLLVPPSVERDFRVRHLLKPDFRAQTSLEPGFRAHRCISRGFRAQTSFAPGFKAPPSLTPGFKGQTSIMPNSKAQTSIGPSFREHLSVAPSLMEHPSKTLRFRARPWMAPLFAAYSSKAPSFKAHR
jgi:hypothetical protein